MRRVEPWAVLAAGALAIAEPASAALWPFGAKPAPATAAKPADNPAPAASAAKPLFHIKGFRSAQFGMTQAQVLAAIAADFKIPADKVQIGTNPQQRTTVLSTTVDMLDPGPGPATVAYVLGATSHRLMSIDVSWVRTGEPAAADRLALVNDGVILVNYFRGQGWPDGAVRAGLPLGPNALLLFSAKDPDGAAVEVDVQGVAYEQQQAGKTVASPPPKGPAALTLVYTQDVDHPDIYRLPPGAF